MKDDSKRYNFVNGVVEYQIAVVEDQITVVEDQVAVVEDELNDGMKMTVKIIVAKKLISLQGLFDTGSCVSMINHKHLPQRIYLHKYSKILSGVNGALISVNGFIKAQVIINNNILDVDLVVVTEGTLNHEVLIGRDFIMANDLGLVVIDKDRNIIISSKVVKKGYDVKEMNEIFNDSDETVLEVHEKDSVELGDLNVGDSEETQVIQGLVTDLFNDNYVKLQKPTYPIVKQEVVINLKSSKIFHATPMRYSLPEKLN